MVSGLAEINLQMKDLPRPLEVINPHISIIWPSPAEVTDSDGLSDNASMKISYYYVFSNLLPLNLHVFIANLVWSSKFNLIHVFFFLY